MRLPLSVLAILLLLLAPGCAYQKLLKHGTSDQKFDAAKKYYDKGDYNRALPLLEDLLGTFNNREQAASVYMYYAKTHYGLRDYYLAGYHFGRFAETYRRSPDLEEAAFLAAKCSYHETLAPELDQTSTEKAIERIQLFINKYPESKFIEECNKLIDELRGKLHEKAYDLCMLYYHMEDYRSAVVALKNSVIEYPDIPQKNEIDYLIVESTYLYAIGSVLKTQPERLETTLSECKDYYASHEPNDTYLAKVKEIEIKARKRLDALKKESNIPE